MLQKSGIYSPVEVTVVETPLFTGVLAPSEPVHQGLFQVWKGGAVEGYGTHRRKRGLRGLGADVACFKKQKKSSLKFEVISYRKKKNMTDFCSWGCFWLYAVVRYNLGGS